MDTSDNILKGDKTTTKDHSEWVSTETVMISADTKFEGYRLRNFYIAVTFQQFAWITFHFTMIYFFTFQLKSIVMVGVFLGFANFMAFLLDIPLGIIQKYFSAKKLFFIATISQLIAVGIFLNFIYNVIGISLEWSVWIVNGVLNIETVTKISNWFFGSAFNWVLLMIATLCYGLTKELNDVTTFCYVLTNANPSEYSKILSRNNILSWLGGMSGLLLSWIVLGISPTFAVFSLGIIIAWLSYFTLRFFDNATESIDIKDIKNFTISIKKINTENIREYIVETISSTELEKVIGKIKNYIFIKPAQKEQKIPWHEILVKTKIELGIIRKILLKKPHYLSIYWTLSMILVFGFWDTFAASFLVSFLDDLKPGWSYTLLGIIAIPAFWLQEVWGNIATKLGTLMVGGIWLTLSGISLICMGIFAGDGMNIYIILTCALINSVWYAAGMSLGQSKFLEEYNIIYAKTLGLNEIDGNASAAPMKILQNFANVIWLVFWGVLLSILSYRWFFILFGCIILGVLYWSISRKDEIQV